MKEILIDLMFVAHSSFEPYVIKDHPDSDKVYVTWNKGNKELAYTVDSVVYLLDTNSWHQVKQLVYPEKGLTVTFKSSDSNRWSLGIIENMFNESNVVIRSFINKCLYTLSIDEVFEVPANNDSILVALHQK